jgi:catechol 2,3-dioxygenase-like lactoylglutathione lyase family enzyme
MAATVALARFHRVPGAELESSMNSVNVEQKSYEMADKISSFMNIRVADIHACYELWRSRGAKFITEPKEKYGETRCYIRDPDGYLIEVGQSKPEFTYG